MAFVLRLQVEESLEIRVDMWKVVSVIDVEIIKMCLGVFTRFHVFELSLFVSEKVVWE